MFFGLSPLELVVLAGLGLALFGPDKLPGALRETARVVRHIKTAGEGARAELLEQLGPEFADLDPRRPDPRTLVREKLSEAFEPVLCARDDIRGELRDVRDAARFDDHADRLAAAEAAALAGPASSAQPEGAVKISAIDEVVPDAHSGTTAGGAADGDLAQAAAG